MNELWTQRVVATEGPSLFTDVIIDGEHFSLHCSLRTEAKKMFNSNVKDVLDEIRHPDLTNILQIMSEGKEDVLRELISTFITNNGNKDISYIFSSACFYKLYNIASWVRTDYSDYIDVNQGLEAACESGDEGIVNMVLIMEANDYATGLKGAAHSGHIPLVKKMIMLGARNFNSALEVAAAGDHQSVITYITSVCTANIDFNFLLWGASEGGNLLTVKNAISNGATDYHTAYWKALQGGVREHHSKYSVKYGTRRNVPSEPHLAISVYLLELMDRL